MPKFRVLAEMTMLLECDIEADNYEQAEQIATDMDGGSFDIIENTGGWRIVNIEENKNDD